jgi:hypothetical protein
MYYKIKKKNNGISVCNKYILRPMSYEEQYGRPFENICAPYEYTFLFNILL